MCSSQYRVTISMAGLVFEIDSPSNRTKYQCYKYLSDGTPNIYIRLSRHELDQEINELVKQGIENQDRIFYGNNNHIIYTINEVNETIIETNAVYRKLVEKVLPYNILLMHGAVVAKDANSYMFTAPSGTGKTTHIMKWLEHGDGIYVVNGDKPLIKITETSAIACGTPWSGKEQLNTNAMVPLKAIIIMTRSENNELKKIPFSQAYAHLLQQIHIPKDRDGAKMTLNLLQRLNGLVDFYLFNFNNFKEDCFDIAYKTLVGDV